jgi:hypothetical protein
MIKFLNVNIMKRLIFFKKNAPYNLCHFNRDFNDLA